MMASILKGVFCMIGLFVALVGHAFTMSSLRVVNLIGCLVLVLGASIIIVVGGDDS